MKKAFDQNVSRARPKLRLGGGVPDAVTESEPTAPPPATIQEAAEDPRSVSDLSSQLRERVEKARQPRVAASEAISAALAAPVEVVYEAPVATVTYDPPPAATAPQAFAEPEAQPARPAAPVARAPVASFVPPPALTEVQTPALPVPEQQQDLDPGTRRDRLRERLRAVRENPRPEPLPATSHEAGSLAVERIAGLQVEVHKLRALNLALTQDLETARRQSERATEEARARMEEARRLSTEMEQRAKLLAELERELSNLESERDEALLALQESRQEIESSEKERTDLRAVVAQRDQALADSLSEEERLADELETAQTDMTSVRRALEAVTTERDTLARQVSELTRERSELLEARKALEAVHRALSQAVAR